jgi:hypothetical protein
VEATINGDPEKLRLLRTVGLYGPNASGKSTVLRAARALGNLIFRAARFRSDEPISVYEPFAGDTSVEKPVRLGMKAVVNGNVYDYEIAFNSSQVVLERLDQRSFENSVNLFHRENQSVTGDWVQNEQFRLIVRDFRPNALLLSLADTLAPTLANRLAPSLRRLLRFQDASTLRDQLLPFNDQPAARLAHQSPEFRAWLLNQLKGADVGVSDLTVKRFRRVLQSQGFSMEEILDQGEGAGSGHEPEGYRFALTHAGPLGPFPVPYEGESYGTRKIIQLAPVLFELASSGGPIAAFVDEIGAALHPNLLASLVQHINCEERSGQAQGQLIFATHETSLIDNEAKNAILRRDQVYFTEKLSSGIARLYSLGDFQERQNVNLRKRYLEGRYGAIPSLRSFPE